MTYSSISPMWMLIGINHHTSFPRTDKHGRMWIFIVVVVLLVRIFIFILIEICSKFISLIKLFSFLNRFSLLLDIGLDISSQFFFYSIEKFLCVRPYLSARSCSNVLFDFLPISTINAHGFNEFFMFITRPSTRDFVFEFRAMAPYIICVHFKLVWG